MLADFPVAPGILLVSMYLTQQEELLNDARARPLQYIPISHVH